MSWLTRDPRWIGSLRAWLLSEQMRKAHERHMEAYGGLCGFGIPRMCIDVDAALSVPIPRPAPEGDMIVRRALARAMTGARR